MTHIYRRLADFHLGMFWTLFPPPEETEGNRTLDLPGTSPGVPLQLSCACLTCPIFKLEAASRDLRLHLGYLSPKPRGMALSLSLVAICLFLPRVSLLPPPPVLCFLFLPLTQVSGLYQVRMGTTEVAIKG